MSIIAIQRLNYTCKLCEKSATFDITMTNDDLPDGYMRTGTRSECFCDDHLPSSARGWFEYMNIAAQQPHGVG